MLKARHALFFAIVSAAAIAALLPRPEPPPTHAYSPFAVRVAGHPAFEVITFKRVGHAVPDSSDPSHEEFAASLAANLSAEGVLMTEVVHVPELLDPNAHVFCDADHLYVDYWATSPGWGYSLWSGCGEDERFAWSEFPVSEGDPLDALSLEIINALATADQTGCYRREC